MIKSLFKNLLQASLFLGLSLPLYASDDVFTGAGPTPYPRFIEIPPIRYSLDKPSIEGDLTVTFSPSRTLYTFVCVVASWNPSSSTIAQLFNENYKKFTSRHIDILVLFSNDTVKSIDSWKAQINPKFPVGFAARNFLDATGNPKIPTIWFLNKKGHILSKLEMPTEDKVQQLIRKAYLMTDF